MEQVQAVQFALRDEDEFFEMGNNGGDGFHSIRISAESFWSTDMISLASCGMLLLFNKALNILLSLHSVSSESIMTHDGMLHIWLAPA